SPKEGCESSTMNAVIEQTRNVSKYTPRDCTKPCLAGCETAAVAPALGAEPIPASFENRPRRTPGKITHMTPTVTQSLQTNAPKMICRNTEGTRLMFRMTTKRPKPTYITAMTGTRIWVMAEIERTPP